MTKALDLLASIHLKVFDILLQQHVWPAIRTWQSLADKLQKQKQIKPTKGAESNQDKNEDGAKNDNDSDDDDGDDDDSKNLSECSVVGLVMLFGKEGYIYIYCFILYNVKSWYLLYYILLLL